MQPTIHRVLILLILCWSTAGLAVTQDQPAQVALDQQTSQWDISGLLQYWKDESGQAGIASVLAPRQQATWQSLDGKVANFGFDATVYWYRITLTNRATDRHRFILEVGYPPLDNIQVFGVANDQVLWQNRSGDKMPFGLRSIQHHNLLFRLLLQPGQTQTLYVRVQTGGAHQLPLTVWHEDAFHEYSQQKVMFHSLYFGLMLALAIYNLLFFLSVRDYIYIFYVLSVTSFALFQATMQGFSFQYLWPNGTHLNDVSILQCMNLFAFSSVMFVVHFLQMGTNNPRFYRFYRLFALINLVGLFTAPWLPYKYAITFFTMLGMPMNVLTVIIGVHAWLNGNHHARYFVAGWSVFLSSVLLLGLNKLGIVPRTTVTEYAAQIGSSIEVILFSFALADRIHFIQHKNRLLEKEAKDALLASNQALAESIRVKDEFLATISHEMRTPMNGVLGNLENMGSADSSDEQEKYRVIATHSAEQMIGLVDAVLCYAELQAGPIRIETSEFSLHDTLNELTLRFGSRASGKDLTLSNGIAPDCPDWVCGDRPHLVQALGCLLDNAIKFTEQGNITLLSTGQQDPRHPHQIQVEVRVQDTGIGVEPQAAHQIFEQFKQADAAHNRRYGGLGLGLTISRALAQALGGDVQYAPLPSGGSEFCMSFRVTPIPAPQQRPPHSVPEPLPQSVTVLMVEDNPVNQMVLKTMLEKSGYRVIVANHGGEAIDAVQQQQVDVVLMDLQMPNVDGFEATQRIRALPSPVAKVPIIAVTANVMGSDRERCKAVGMNHFLSKPVKKSLLLKVIQHTLQTQAMP